MRTTNGYNIPAEMVGNYLGGLVNQFFKILPIKESGRSEEHTSELQSH